jgi:hypothetical protein
MLFYNIMHQFIIDNQSNMHIYFGMLAWFHDFCVYGTLRTRYTTLDGRRAACLPLLCCHSTFGLQVLCKGKPEVALFFDRTVRHREAIAAGERRVLEKCSKSLYAPPRAG